MDERWFFRRCTNSVVLARTRDVAAYSCMFLSTSRLPAFISLVRCDYKLTGDLRLDSVRRDYVVVWYSAFSGISGF